MQKIFAIVIILLGTSFKVQGGIMKICSNGYFFDDHCPKEKPFSYYDYVGDNGDWLGCGVAKNCIAGCDTLNVIHILDGHEDDFLICENRETIGYVSRLKVCPTEYPLREYNGDCVPCKGVNLVRSKQDCDVCPNLKYEDQFCYKKWSFEYFRHKLNQFLLSISPPKYETH